MLREVGMGVVLVLWGTGCHGKLKQSVESIDEVRVDVDVMEPPRVRLGLSQLGTASSTSGDVVQRFQAAVASGAVEEAFVDELDDLLGEGPPFSVGPGSDAELRVIVKKQVLRPVGSGGVGALVSKVTTELYGTEGELVYRANHRCKDAFGSQGAGEAMFGIPDIEQELRKRSDEELAELMMQGSRRCAQTTLQRIRKHGG